VAIPWALLLVVLAVVRVDGAPPRRGLAVALLVVGIALPVTPVAVANARAGRPLVASSAVFNIWLGLNDPPLSRRAAEIGATEVVDFRASGETPAARNAAYRQRIGEKIAAEGIVAIARAQLAKQYQRLFDRDSFFVEQLPGGDRSAYRFEAPWLRAVLRIYADFTHALVLVAAAFGVALLRSRRVDWPQLFAAFLLYNLALFSVFHVTPRLLVQMIPFMALLGGAPVAAYAGEDAAGGAFVAAGRGRLLLGTALAALLLTLAFASVLG
jgi:hypothetical protein